MTSLEISIVILCAAAGSLLSILFLNRTAQTTSPSPPPQAEGMSFLFRDCDLEHASPDGAALLSTSQAETDWHALRASVLPRFPDFPSDDELRTLSTLDITAEDPCDTGLISLERRGDLVRVEIMDRPASDARSVDTIRSLQARAQTLEMAAETAPYPIWLINSEGQVAWFNPSYGALLDEYGNGASTVPLFDTQTIQGGLGASERLSITSTQTGRDAWYDITITRKGSYTICHAVDINAVIQAEIAQRNFVQALAKTFAHLSIGLAIFDRNRQLALFNPALLDLTSLPVEFLSARPDVLTFFDRLRDNRVMPEPKNYKTWRQEISDLIAAATSSSYQETWSLDTGHTYRVNGRPHPDGAVAFLIEDITAEIALTRNFRAELETGQAITDTIEDALAVFSSTGVLTFCNAAYRTMWKMDPDKSFADITIEECCTVWREKSDADLIFEDIQSAVLNLENRKPWDCEIHLEDGQMFSIRVTPIVAGATLVRFGASTPVKITKAQEPVAYI